MSKGKRKNYNAPVLPVKVKGIKLPPVKVEKKKPEPTYDYRSGVVTLPPGVWTGADLHKLLDAVPKPDPGWRQEFPPNVVWGKGVITQLPGVDAIEQFNKEHPVDPVEDWCDKWLKHET